MLGIQLDEQLSERLEALAKKKQVSQEAILVEALKCYISREEVKDLGLEGAQSLWEHYQVDGEVVDGDLMIEWLRACDPRVKD